MQLYENKSRSYPDHFIAINKSQTIHLKQTYIQTVSLYLCLNYILDITILIS